MLSCLPYREVWAVDFEYIAHGGNRPEPVCMIAIELRTRRILRIWRDELHKLEAPPLSCGPDSLFVAYFASAELGCFLALGWSMPARMLDLYVEFRAITNGRPLPSGRGLLGALVHYGLPHIGGEEKDEMRALVQSGGPWTAVQVQAILDYCETDVDALARLLTAMVPSIVGNSQRLGQALLRGRYMAAVARIEWAGVPVDVSTLQRLRGAWDGIKAELIRDVDQDFGVYEGQTFKRNRFEAHLINSGIAWPRLDSGALALDDDTFKDMARRYPQLAPLRQLRHTLSELRLNALQVGTDGRNRCLLSPYGARTGRNTPSNAKFVFGPSKWLRGLIKPAPGFGLAYCDWANQEIAVAAALSGDGKLMEACRSGDPYLAFAKQAGLVPGDATKETHRAMRSLAKTTVLGINYGMSAYGIAQRIGIGEIDARHMLQRHRETYRSFWDWTEGNINAALLGMPLKTVFGWPLRLGPGSNVNTRSLQNYPMQANGAEMMRLAACMATEAGLTVCAPVHDAFLLEAPRDQLEAAAAQLREIMVDASRLVLRVPGLECRVDVDYVRWPDRYISAGGSDMWRRVMKLLTNVEQKAA